MAPPVSCCHFTLWGEFKSWGGKRGEFKSWGGKGRIQVVGRKEENSSPGEERGEFKLWGEEKNSAET